jgi:integrase
MAVMRVRYLVVRAGAAGAPPKYFWQPSPQLRDRGWRQVRVPAVWRDLGDTDLLLAGAIAEANRRNAELDRWREHATAPAAPKPPALRTLGGLIRLYEESGFPPAKRGPRQPKALAPKTIRDYRQCLGELRRWGADAPIGSITAHRLKKLHEGLAAKPARAAAVMRVARLLLEFGRGEDWLQINPADRLGVGASAPMGILWPREAVAAFVEAADRLGRRSIGDAIVLDEWLGQRQADVLRWPIHVLDAGGLVVRQRKGGAGVRLPVALVPALVVRVEAALARHKRREDNGAPAPTRLIVSEATGLPYREDNFRHVFGLVRAAVSAAHPSGFAIDYLRPGRPDDDPAASVIHARELWFMHLRHTAVVRLAEAGAETAQIAAITGHSLASVNQILDRYLVRTGELARAAFQKRLDKEG